MATCVKAVTASETAMEPIASEPHVGHATRREQRFGVAFEAEIFVGKVLSNQGSALGRSTLAGIEWAVARAALSRR